MDIKLVNLIDALFCKRRSMSEPEKAKIVSPGFLKTPPLQNSKRILFSAWFDIGILDPN
jgi:hypothetical protein